MDGGFLSLVWQETYIYVGWAAPLSMEEKLILPNRIFLPLILSTCLTDCGKIYYLKSNRRRQERLIGKAFSEGLTLYQEPFRGVHCCTSLPVVFATLSGSRRCSGLL